MINGGEETPRREDASSGGAASLDPFDVAGSKSDGDDASPSSRYSSCGESEFERYCSANSVMGTPSLCSSVHYTDCLESEFGSFRSFGDDSSLDGCSLEEGRSGRSTERNLRIRFSHGSSTCNEASLNNGVDVSVTAIPVLGDKFVGALDEAESRTLKEGTLFEERNASLSVLGSEGNDILLSQLTSDDEMLLGGEKVDEGAGGESLKYGHLDDEDSTHSYGSDDDSGKNLPYLRNIKHDLGGKHEGNPLLMNSSVAFGADDWNDFIQETGEVEADPLLLATFYESRGGNLETQGHPTYFPSESWIGSSIAGKIEEGKDLRDLPLGREQVLDPDDGSRSKKAGLVNPSGCGEPAETSFTGRQDVGGGRINKNRSSTTPVSIWNSHEQYLEDVRDSSQSSKQIRVADESEEYLNSCSVTNIFETDQEPIIVKAHLELEEDPRVEEISKEVDHPSINQEKLINIDRSQRMEDIQLEDIDTKLDILVDSTASQLSFLPIMPLNIKTDLSDEEKQNSSEVTAVGTDHTRNSMSFHLSTDIYEEHNSSSKVSF